MFRYMFLLSRTLVKKVSLYIVAIVAIIIFSLIFAISIQNSNDREMLGLTSTNTFIALIVFIFTTLFTLLTIVHIFKQGEIDGSELMIVAKPITRKEILLGKFLMLLIMIVLFQLILVIDFGLLSTADKYATSAEKSAWLWSLILGGFIIQLIVSSIIVLLTSVLGKVGTIVVTLLVSSVLGIASIILQSFGTVNPFGYSYGDGSENKINSVYIDNSSQDNNYYVDDSKISNDVWDNQDNFNYYKSNLLQNFAIEDYEARDGYLVAGESVYKSYEDKHWYESAAYADLWYQWSRFYSLFNSDKINFFDAAFPKPLKYKKVSFDELNDRNKFMIGDTSYVWLLQDDTHDNNYQTSYGFTSRRQNQLKLELDATFLIKNLETNSDFKTSITKETNFYSQLKYIKFYEEKIVYSNSESTYETTYLDKNSLNKYIKTFIYFNNTWDTLKTTTMNVPANVFTDYSGNPVTFDGLDTIGIYNKDTLADKVIILESSEIIETWVVVLIWVLLGLLLLGGSILIYAYRDFK